MSTDILSTHNLAVGYPGNHGSAPRIVLSGLSLTLPAASVTVLVGANGIGKSTLLRTIAGAQPPIAGRVIIDGRDVASISPRRRARMLALVYTDRTGGGGLTVGEVVSLGRQPYTGFLGRLDQDDRDIVSRAMTAVGISDKAGRYLASLSDGERQKTMIARALAQQTPLIVLDEPTAFLDVASRLEIMQLLGRLAADEGKTVLLSTHDIAPAMAIADRLWVVDACAATIIEGPAEAVIAAGAMDLVFPGRNVAYDPAARDFRSL